MRADFFSLTIVMANKELSHERKNGVYYTPSILARTLVEPIVESPNQKILDPAYGDGALLLAAEQILREKYQSRKKRNLFGCDVSPIGTRTRHLPASNLSKGDFFDFPMSNQFDLIVMNPPYVRHHYLNKETAKTYQSKIKDKFKIKKTSDLWAYFIVKASLHLKKGGSIGAILPWSFLQADFSSSLREWITDNFRDVKMLVLGANLFDKAQERVVLVWMKGYSLNNQSISIGHAHNTFELVNFHHISRQQFTRDKVNLTYSNDCHDLIDRYKTAFGFTEFENLAKTSIGVVTGANDFFIRKREEAEALDFNSSNLIPIYANSAEFAGFSINGNVPEKVLLYLTESNSTRYQDIISQGVQKKYHERAHSLNRSPWYQVKIGKTPDAFFPYRTSYIPYLMLNNVLVQSSNSIHRIYFKGLTAIERKWAQLSLLSLPAQLSLEAHSKTYGSGVLKIEPGSLNKAICYKSKDRTLLKTYNQVSRLLAANEKVLAMNMATEFINNHLRIDMNTSKSAEELYYELASRRRKGNLSTPPL